MRSSPLPPRVVALLLATWPWAVAAAQPAVRRADAAPTPTCEGLTVTRLEIRPGRPPYEGTSSRWRHAARAVGLHHATTRPGVLDAFTQLAVGDRCTDQRVSESERLLREQPFIADARVTVTPDGAGGVALLFETVDEVPVLVGGRLHGLGLNSFSLGNGNVGGLGLLAQGFVERGFRYRTGAGARMIEYAAFGRPYVATLEAFRHPLGYYRNAELAHPFYTDLQRVAFHLAYRDEEEYRGVSRSARDQLALRVSQQRWDASTIVRAFGTRTVTLLGIGASGLRLTPDPRGIVVSDTGLVPDTGTALVNRYRPFRTVRVGVLGGIRRVSFVPVRGFDALSAQQDVASGVMTGLYAAHGVGGAGENDLFLSGGLYAGRATSRAMLASVVQMEARRDQVANRWDSMIGSGRAALYVTPRAGMLLTVDDRYSTGLDARLPLQLDLGDRLGGILGYRNTPLAGAGPPPATRRAPRSAWCASRCSGMPTSVSRPSARQAPCGPATRPTVGRRRARPSA